MAALVFNTFFAHWCKTVCRERMPADIANFVAANAVGIGNGPKVVHARQIEAGNRKPPIPRQ